MYLAIKMLHIRMLNCESLRERPDKGKGGPETLKNSEPCFVTVQFVGTYSTAPMYGSSIISAGNQ
jgi:hypothetical protein